MGGRVLRHAAFGGGGMGGIGLLGTALLLGQAKLARRAVPIIAGPPLTEAEYGDASVPGRVPLRLAMLGDSGAAGVGCDRPEETMGALLAGALADAAQRPVRLDVLAVSGARSADLDAQVSRALLTPPHLAVIIVGANDVTHFVPRRRATAHLHGAVDRLTAGGVRTVVGTCPDLGIVPPIPQPLRVVAGVLSRQMADAQAAAVTAAGGTPVPLARLVADRFAADPARLFCADRFHPSAHGYRLLADALLSAVRVAAGLDEGGASPRASYAEPGR